MALPSPSSQKAYRQRKLDDDAEPALRLVLNHHRRHRWRQQEYEINVLEETTESGHVKIELILNAERARKSRCSESTITDKDVFRREWETGSVRQ